MLTAETLYQKAQQLDAFHLQEAADFIDFLLNKPTAFEKLEKAPPQTAYRIEAVHMGAKRKNLDKISLILEEIEDSEDHKNADRC